LVLTSRSALPHSGHYLTFIEPASRELTTLGVPGFKEELDVYVADGALRADHAFLAVRAAIPGVALPHSPQTCTCGLGSRTAGLTCRIRRSLRHEP
jgi:hypothetical protein